VLFGLVIDEEWVQLHEIESEPRKKARERERVGGKHQDLYETTGHRAFKRLSIPARLQMHCSWTCHLQKGIPLSVKEHLIGGARSKLLPLTNTIRLGPLK